MSAAAPFIPSVYGPAPIGPQQFYNGAPVASNADNSRNDPARFPQWNPFNNRDVFNQQQTLGQSAFQQGQDWQNQFAANANYSQNLSQGYGQTANDLYSPIWNGGGGYTPDQQAQILQSQGLQDAQGMNSQIAGDPYQTFNYYGSQIAPQMNKISADYATSAMKGAAAGAAGGLGALQYGQNAVNTAAANPGLTPTAQYLQQAGMTDQQVSDTAEAAARGVGAQFQSAQDQVRQNAMAAGNTSPLALGSAMGDLGRSGAAAQADALTSARLQALAQQRAAATGIQNTQLQAGQYQAGLGTQAGLALTNSALQQNQFQTGQNVAATEWAGNQSLANQQFNANMQTQLQGQAEQNASNRAAQIQATNLGINQLQSQRGLTVANQYQQQQQEGRQAAVGQQQYYGGQSNQANQFRLQGQQVTNNATANAASGYQNWGPNSSSGLQNLAAAGNFIGALGGAARNGAQAAQSLGYAHGGLLDHHQLIEVGEGNRPEVILPLDPATSPDKRNIWEHMGAHLGAAMGLNSRPRHFAFGR